MLGPAAVYLGLNALFGSAPLANGWGIPTATDIALAWLVARAVLGRTTPPSPFFFCSPSPTMRWGSSFIAVFYPNPHQPPEPVWLLLVPCGMLAAWLMRRAKVRRYWPYLLLGGGACWIGLYRGNLHPALALACVVPFLPHAKRERGHLFEDDRGETSPLARFVHHWRFFVDFGMFMFGVVNAGVRFTQFSPVTWLVLLGLLLGKSAGIVTASVVAARLGWERPRGMGWRELLVVAVIAAIGFTVSLFIAGEAFTDPSLRGRCQMGALLSIALAVPALLGARLLKVKPRE